jgi:hypothetical protein
MSLFFAAFAAVLGAMAAVAAAPTIFMVALGAAKGLGVLLLAALVVVALWYKRQ